MRKSKYTIYKKIDNKIILFNTLYQSLVIFDNYHEKKLMKILSSPNDSLKNFNQEFYNVLIENKFLIEDDIDELDLLRKYYESFINENLIIKIFLTHYCNFNCSYCYQNHQRIHISDIYENAIINFIKNKINSNIKSVVLTFFGGEPMLLKDKIFKISESVYNIINNKNIKLIANIVTNGSIFDEKFYIKLSEISEHINIQITQDGSKKRHNKMRPFKSGNGSYEIIIKNLKKLDNLKIKNINVVYRLNINEDFTEKDFDDLYKFKNINYFLSIVGIFNNPEQEKNANNDKYVYNLLKKAKEKGFEISSFFKNPLYSCSAGLPNTFTFTPDGKITICTGIDPLNNENNMGYLDPKGNLIITNKKLYNKLYSRNRDVFEFEECRKCNLLPICFGGCAYARKIKEKNDFCIPEKYYLKEAINVELEV
ncbi:radical SAM/SPASM domain-containing protein [Marinitoga aeolica]|uniref:Radical SAM protein n=1 Tax=Marinitoga aeolica TaxID=2809031 RepID=A0ABY8PP38_9BACT|nr:radical SAM protein [Marinitoga aeolica]WGS64346.1 radical SAM protein [Marinitoga aeolica]